jgi:type VI secretion system ImpC/EvpB family protein
MAVEFAGPRWLAELTAAAPAAEGRAGEPAVDAPLRRFLQATVTSEALAAWLGPDFPRDKQALSRRLNRDIGVIDKLLNDQLNAVLHAPAFQRLEAAWRGLHYLAEQNESSAVKIRMLHASWRELERDFERALEFDQSELFKKIYEQEFGTPGGEPYGMVIADYQVHPQPSPAHPHNDLQVVRGLAQVGAAAFCPVILNASPAMFGMDDFGSMQYRIDHRKTFSQASYLSWRSFRDSEHARFIGLAMPRVLIRAPYLDDGTRVDGFCFHEEVAGPHAEKYLWAGAAFALGEVVIRAFSHSGWLADIRGFRRNERRGGIVSGLPVQSMGTDKAGIATKSSTDVIITEELERQLSELGFIPLCQAKDTDYSVFYSSQSAQLPRTYDREAATANARLSSMLPYMLCASRFAHYIKVLVRDKTGAYGEASELERLLQDWIVKYVTADSDAPPEVKARYPLRAAEIQIGAVPGRPGSYTCTMHLSPHFELDELHAVIRLQAELNVPRGLP